MENVDIEKYGDHMASPVGGRGLAKQTSQLSRFGCETHDFRGSLTTDEN